MDGRLTIGYRDYTYPFLRPSFCQAPTSRHVVTLLKNDRIFGRSIPTVRCSVQSQWEYPEYRLRCRTSEDLSACIQPTDKVVVQGVSGLTRWMLPYVVYVAVRGVRCCMRDEQDCLYTLAFTPHTRIWTPCSSSFHKFCWPNERPFQVIHIFLKSSPVLLCVSLWRPSSFSHMSVHSSHFNRCWAPLVCNAQYTSSAVATGWWCTGTRPNKLRNNFK